MRIVLYTPFKPLGHHLPSGDLIIATGLYNYLLGQGLQIDLAGPLRARWIYHKPWLWPRVLAERQRMTRLATRVRPDLWLTYHTYYKAPDVLGPNVCRRTGLPYVIFQAAYSTKQKRRLRTLPGFILNRQALLAANHVFTNQRLDHQNVRRLLPENRMTYLPPGIHPEDFPFDPEARAERRQAWEVGDDPVILTAAMFRPDVKTKGLIWLIEACARLYQRGLRFKLVIAGEGRRRPAIERLARERLPGLVRLVGFIPRPEMHRFYSAGDLFAFPGFQEALGMVYLEAQSCGLPVVAFDNGGIPQVVADGITGLLPPLNDLDAFSRAIERLLLDPDLRRQMGSAAAKRVRSVHNLETNYHGLVEILDRIATKDKLYSSKHP